MRRLNSDESGSVLIWTVLVITILSLAAAELLHVVSSKYTNALQTAQWQESLLAAESGVDLAIRELRKSLFPPPNKAWEGWSSGQSTEGSIERYGISVIPNAGLAGTEMTINVTVDAPLQLRDASNSWQYYRIRALGTMPITGPPRANDNKQDTRLRKLSLKTDRFTGADLGNSGARVTRRVEAIVRPVSAFDQAVMSLSSLDLNDANIVIDSYDSRDPNKSTNGQYDAAERQKNGHIATNGNLINAGNAYVYGDVSTNSGTATGITNVSGVQRTDFYQEPVPVAAPTWPAINSTPMLVAGNANLAAASTEGSASSRYVLSSITIAGTEVLNLTGNADGSTTYIEVYVTGDISATGNSQIIVHPGVKATIYFAGGVKVSGNGLVNKNNQPGNLLMYGVQPPAGSTTKTVELGGSGHLTAAVYAPDHHVHMNNAGTRGTANGSFVGKTFTMTGTTDLHYDEALGSGGRISNYKIVSWFEDTR
ncbi:MAG TPA: hypothetical protein VK993_02195 [Chthoniobacterales bacterium]|nr:hypothetical protein [Chthoniobacterales bacterium]